MKGLTTFLLCHLFARYEEGRKTTYLLFESSIHDRQLYNFKKDLLETFISIKKSTAIKCRVPWHFLVKAI